MKKTGFTLAEVLISLAIVGIIAAITIPQIVTAVIIIAIPKKTTKRPSMKTNKPLTTGLSINPP